MLTNSHLFPIDISYIWGKTTLQDFLTEILSIKTVLVCKLFNREPKWWVSISTKSSILLHILFNYWGIKWSDISGCLLCKLYSPSEFSCSWFAWSQLISSFNNSFKIVPLFLHSGMLWPDKIIDKQLQG